MTGFSWGRTLLVVNPAAHNGEAAQVKDRVYASIASLDACPSLEMVLTTRPGHARSLAARIEGFDTVITLGGDGLVHELCNGLMVSASSGRVALGVVPFGSGNDYARTLGMPLHLDKALLALKDVRRRLLDVGTCNGEFFCETVSFGLDAAIALDTMQRRQRTGRSGAALYAESGIDQLLNHRDVHVAHISIDGEAPRAVELHLFAIQIGKTYGGGFCICPDADPSDGVFDTCIAYAPFGLVEAGVTFMLAKNGRHVNRKNIQIGQARQIDVRFDGQVPAQIDGERLQSTAFAIRKAQMPLQVLSADLG